MANQEGPNKARSRRPRVGRFFVDPDFSGFENAVGQCRECDARLTVNRATELDGTFPSAGTTFRCFSCERTVRLGGDVANHPIDQIAYDALRPMLRREYMQAILMVAQAFEWALSMCVYSILLGGVSRPKRLRRTSPFAIAQKELDDQMERLTLGQLRVVVARLAADAVFPKTISDARARISTLRSLVGSEPQDAAIARIGDVRIREAVQLLVDAKAFVKIRNAIAHQGARPSQPLAEHYYEEIPRLSTRLLRAFCGVQGQMIMPPKAGGGRGRAR